MDSIKEAIKLFDYAEILSEWNDEIDRQISRMRRETDAVSLMTKARGHRAAAEYFLAGLDERATKLRESLAAYPTRPPMV